MKKQIISINTLCGVMGIAVSAAIVHGSTTWTWIWLGFACGVANAFMFGANVRGWQDKSKEQPKQGEPSHW